METTSNGNPIWSARVLDLTRTTTAYRDLETAVTDLHTALNANIHPKHSDERETLTEALANLHTKTTDAWLNVTPMHWGFHDMTRTAAIARAEQLRALAEDAATAAHYIADMLERAHPLDTVELLTDQITEAASVLEDGRDTPDLAALWGRLGPSDLIDDAGAVQLRRMFDRYIDATDNADLSADVIAWRAAHLGGQQGPITWDAATFEYAITTVRAWAEMLDVWERIAPAVRDGHLTAAEGIRVRDKISEHVRAGGSTPAMYPQLREALHDYDTKGVALAARIRFADDWPTLERIWLVLRDSDDLERLGIVRALLRKARAMQLSLHNDSDSAWRDLDRANGLMSQLDDWHRKLYQTSALIAEGRGDNYSQDEAYTILYNALEAAEDTGNIARAEQLIGYAEAAHARGRITDDRYTVLETLIARKRPAPAAPHA